MPLKICSHPTCNRLQREARCEEHRYKQTRTAEQRDKFYESTAWRKYAKAHLAVEPTCRECLKYGKVRAAEQVDHIKPRQTHPELEWDEDNLQSLCRPCHTRKTRRESK